MFEDVICVFDDCDICILGDETVCAFSEFACTPADDALDDEEVCTFEEVCTLDEDVCTLDGEVVCIFNEFSCVLDDICTNDEGEEICTFDEFICTLDGYVLDAIDTALDDTSTSDSAGELSMAIAINNKKHAAVPLITFLFILTTYPPYMRISFMKL